MSVFEIPYELGQRSQLLKPFRLTYKQYQTTKRIFDMAICLAMLPFLLVPAVVISLAIMLDSPGSPLFVQERIGFGGRRFKIYKFRTMRSNLDDTRHRTFMKSFVAGQMSDKADGEEKEAKFKPIHKSDLTRIGKLLRKTSLDELPQIINVLKGDMSLIGPRPNVPWEVEAYKPWHHSRLDALPGITGLAQVMGRSNISFDMIARYDIQYVKNQAFHFDLWIMWQTFSTVIKGNGAG